MPARIPTRAFGVGTKLFLLLGGLAFIFSGAAAFSLYGLRLVRQSSEAIARTEIPVIRSIQEALRAMLAGKIALENVLTVNDPAQTKDVETQEAVLKEALARIDAFLAAITWGSESEAFKKSDDGLNFAEWQRLDPEERFTVERASPEQAQLAGITALYFGGFANNALRAIAHYKDVLRLRAEDNLAGAEASRRLALEHTVRAFRFSGLAAEKLTAMARLSNGAIAESTRAIEKTQRTIQRNTVLIFGIGLTASLLIGLVFTRRDIINPLRLLTEAARKISQGDLTSRAPVIHEDEIGMLARAFNNMAGHIADYASNLERRVKTRTEELTRANARLAELLNENQESAKMLVRRDLELTEANTRLTELDRLKSEFVSVAAHQLRTPLAGIKWSLVALLEQETGAVNVEQKKIIEAAHAATLGMIELINDLLNVARIEEGRFGFRFIAQSLLPLIENLMPGVQRAAQKKGVALNVKLPKVKMPSIQIDGEKIIIALDNVLENAVKYTQPGGSVELLVKQGKDAIRITVKDSGIGIPEKQLSRVFQKFFRADNALLYQTAGTGLGLYVVKNIVESHGGSIEVQSKEGQGTTVTFTLPMPG